MQATDQRSAPHSEPPRQHLTSRWTLLGIALAVSATLALIFPGRGLLAPRFVEQQHTDAVDVTHVDTMAGTEPQNAEPGFAAAQKHKEAGNLPEARAILERLSTRRTPPCASRPGSRI